MIITFAILISVDSFEFSLCFEEESSVHGTGTPNLLWHVVPKERRVAAIPNIAHATTTFPFLRT